MILYNEFSTAEQILMLRENIESWQEWPTDRGVGLQRRSGKKKEPDISQQLMELIRTPGASANQNQLAQLPRGAAGGAEIKEGMLMFVEVDQKTNSMAMIMVNFK